MLRGIRRWAHMMLFFYGFLPPEPTFPYPFDYFDPIAFRSFGDHYAVVFGADQEGELVVSGTLPELQRGS